MKKNQDNVGYYSIIPATILYNKELKANEKLLYAIITSLACKEGYCFAINKYLAENGQAIHQKVKDNSIRNNIKNNTKVPKKSISNYTNPREYSEEFLNSLYANLK